MSQLTGYIGRSPGDSNVVVARQIYQPTGSQTTFTFSSGYNQQYLDLYLNGSKLVRNIDYTAGDGVTLSLVTPSTSGDVLEAVAYKAFNVVTSNATIGISSNSIHVGNAEALNFVGAGHTFNQNGSTIDVELSLNIANNGFYVTGGSLGIGTDNPVTSIDVDTTDSVKLPVGTEAQRPGTPAAGMIRFNDDVDKFEVYDGSNWGNLISGDIGTDADEVPLNQFLGDQAFVDDVGTVIPSASDPQRNKDINFEYVSDTSIKIRMRGADGTVRSTTLTLS